MSNNIDLTNITLPRTYKVSFRKLFFPVLWIPMLTIFMALQVNIMIRVKAIVWSGLILIAIGTFLLARMIQLVKINLISITVTADGVISRKSFSSSEKSFSWEDIKRFKYKVVKSQGRIPVRVYVLEDRTGDKIVFNTLLNSSDELVELIKQKVKLREWA